MRHLSIAVLLCIVATAAHAQRDTVIYRCTDAKGALTIQNGNPCPKGSKQQKVMVEPPTIMPAYSAPAPATQKPPAPPLAPLSPAAPKPPDIAHPQTPAPATIADADRLPPPPIYQCNTWDNDSYISETATVEPRCVRLQTTDLQGDPNAAGQACEMKIDQCQRVPDGAACDGWKKRRNEVEATWRYAKAADKAPLQEEFARVSTILSESTCGR